MSQSGCKESRFRPSIALDSHERPALQIAASRNRTTPLVALGLGAALAVAIYVFGRNHSPDYTTSLFGSSGTGTYSVKAGIATGVLVLAVLQITSAAWIFGKLPRLRPASRPVKLGHRLVGALAILATIPVAYHCIFAYGVQTMSARVAVHSIAGCLLYGTILVKIAGVRLRRMPALTLPLAGGALVTLVVVLWYTSALWKFNNYSLPVL